MCGIAGILSDYQSTSLVPNLLAILSNLINRGKDGTGIGYIDNNGKIIIHKTERAAPEFTEEFGDLNVDCNLAIGHVRLPTVGIISELNSHPVLDCTGNIAVAHNGTIKNFNHLVTRLKNENHIFKTTIDSEVIPHLLEKYYNKTENMEKSILKTVEHLEGYYTFAVLSNYEPDRVYLYRHHFPMVVFKDEDDTYFSSERKPLVQVLSKRFRAHHLKKDELNILSR